jgi:hypothetical protein
MFLSKILSNSLFFLLQFSFSSSLLSNYSSFSNTDVTTCNPPCIRAGQPCGYGSNQTCDVELLASICDSIRECLSFNTNGWLKGCAAVECGASFETSLNTTLYVKNGGYWPSKPVDPVFDWYYSSTRNEEESIYQSSLPLVISVGNGYAILRVNETVIVNVSQNHYIADDYFLLATIPTQQIIFIERVFSTWAAISMLSLTGEVSRLPRTVGQVFGLDKSPGASNYSSIINNQPDYYDAAASLKNDIIGERILSSSFENEPTFEIAAAFLPPQRDYASIGAPSAATKYSVSPDGRIKLASGDIYTPATNGSSELQPGILIFDTASIADFWPQKNWTVTKSGLVGGYLRIIATAGFDVDSGLGVEQISFAPAADPSESVLVRLRCTNGTDIFGHDNSFSGYRYYNASQSKGVSSLVGDAASFYLLLFDEQHRWLDVFKDAASIQLPGMEGKRQIDALWSGITTTLSLYIGNESNYGDGGAYYAPNGSLTSEIAPIAEALLSLGLRNIAKDLIGYYFDHFIRVDGSLPECDDCLQGGFGEALSDYGEMLEIFSHTAYAVLVYDNDVVWINKYLPSFIRLANYTLHMRLNASSSSSSSNNNTTSLGGNPINGLVFGSPEHDTCKEPDYYYHNNLWLARGLKEAAKLISLVGGDTFASFAALLASEASLFAIDINASIALVTINLDDGVFWIPPIASTALNPFNTMTESILSSYTNFRYLPESISSGMLSETLISGMLAFRDTRGGVLAGNTRFEGHLDNMPAYGYAKASLRLMDIPTGPAAMRFFLQSFGHMANYMSRGTFSASEQLSFYSDSNGLYRDYLWEYLEGGIDQCVPSLILSTLITRWALIFEWKDENKIWLARGAPRRWYNKSEDGFSINNMPTRFGSFSFNTSTSLVGVSITRLVFIPPPFGVLLLNTTTTTTTTTTIYVILRLRSLSSLQKLVNVSFVNISPINANVSLIDLNATREEVTIEIGDKTKNVSIDIHGMFV